MRRALRGIVTGAFKRKKAAAANPPAASVVWERKFTLSILPLCVVFRDCTGINLLVKRFSEFFAEKLIKHSEGMRRVGQSLAPMHYNAFLPFAQFLVGRILRKIAARIGKLTFSWVGAGLTLPNTCESACKTIGFAQFQ